MIKLKRKDSSVDRGCPYEVYINDKLVCKINNGEELGLDLKQGEYVIQIKAHNFTSEKVKFTLFENQFASFICYPLYSENKGTKFIYKSLFNKVGIALEKQNDFYL